jgi:hypothetical protein
MARKPKRPKVFRADLKFNLVSTLYLRHGFNFSKPDSPSTHRNTAMSANATLWSALEVTGTGKNTSPVPHIRKRLSKTLQCPRRHCCRSSPKRALLFPRSPPVCPRLSPRLHLFSHRQELPPTLSLSPILPPTNMSIRLWYVFPSHYRAILTLFD